MLSACKNLIIYIYIDTIYIKTSISHERECHFGENCSMEHY